MFCSTCGKEINKEAAICPNCGVPTKNMVAATEDNGGFGWSLLGCCIPIVGLILFLVWKDTKPKTAKAAGIGALVMVGLVVLLYAILFAIGIFTATTVNDVSTFTGTY